MEYQGKDLFRRVGIPTPSGVYATTADDVKTYIAEHPGSWVLKSQVMMGGRGKAGGIKFADDALQGETLARELIGKVLKSIQNPDGEEVKSLLVEEKVDIASEAYVSIAIDRASKKPVVLVTAQGGMDVEEVAEHDPDAIVKYWIDPATGYSPFIGRRLAFAAKLPDGYRKAFPAILDALYTLFMDYGANLVEINPLVLTKDGRVIASDAKVELDDNGLYKHPDVAQWNKQSPADEDQARAVAIGLGMSNYARFADEAGQPPKTVGTIANGAGLGMGTMDAVKNAGGGAANFLDIGGGAQAELVKNSYNLVTSDARVKAMFINIFGGITRGDQVAQGIVDALKGDDVRKVPLVIRLTGTNAEEGRKILADAGFFPVETMDEGAARAVALANGEK
ncbi:MAG: ADP-forming succinate--CoA ligase subunit beta [Candidatus Elarobacter sp.]